MPTGAAAGWVLTSDAAGAATWQAPQATPDGDWVISGGNIFSAVPGNVGVRTPTPQANLHVRGDAAPSVSMPPNTEAMIEDDDNPVLNFVSSNTGNQTIAFGDPENINAGGIAYSHADNSLRLRTDGIERMAVLADGRVGIGSAAIPGTRLSVADASGQSGVRVVCAQSTSPTAQGAIGIFGAVASGDSAYSGAGVMGASTSSSGASSGVDGYAAGARGAGLRGEAGHTTGRNYGLLAGTSSPNGYAGYFYGGRNYFQGKVGIGNERPVQRLHVADMENGGLKYAMKVDNQGNTDGTATGILFKVDRRRRQARTAARAR